MRKTELSRLESLLHHRSRRVPRTTRLTFLAVPQSSSDEVASLAHNNPENLEFGMYRAWLRGEVSHITTGLPILGHKDADQRRAALLRRMDSELRRLADLEEVCWDREKILARVPGFYFLPDIADPVIILPRAYATALDMCCRN